MKRRSRGREVAMQLLFQRDQNPRTQRQVYEQFASTRLNDPELRQFCLELFDGVVAHQADIDRKIAASSDNWKLHRIAPVDRNLLRIGAFELLHRTDTPAAVAFDEMIELARRFGTSNSSSFVNGVLDRLLRDVKQAAEEAERKAETGTADASAAEPPSADAAIPTETATVEETPVEVPKEAPPSPSESLEHTPLQ